MGENMAIGSQYLANFIREGTSITSSVADDSPQDVFTQARLMKASSNRLPSVTVEPGDKFVTLDMSAPSEFFRVNNRDIGDVNFTRPSADPSLPPTKTREKGYETTLSRAPKVDGPYEPVPGHTTTNSTPQVIKGISPNNTNNITLKIGDKPTADT